MKKLLFILAIAFTFSSCGKKEGEVAQMKTAYVDTQKLMEECKEAKDIEAKYKNLADTKGKQIRRRN